MQPKLPSIERTREKCEAAELRCLRSFTCSSPGCKWDLEGPTSWERQGSPQGCFILAEFDHHRSAEPAQFPGQFGKLGSAPCAQHRVMAVASKHSSRGSQHQPSPRNEPDPTFKTEKQVSTDNS